MNRSRWYPLIKLRVPVTQKTTASDVTKESFISHPNVCALNVSVCRLLLSKVWKAFTHHTVSTAAVLNKEDGQCTYRRNIKARSCNHSCTGKAINVTYPECLFQRAVRMSYIVICDLSGCTMFFRIS